MPPAVIAMLQRDSWFGALSPERRAAIARHLQIRSVANGTHLYRIGDPPNGLHVVIEGRVRMVSYPSAGIEMVNIVFGPGRWFGELSVIDGQPRPHDAIVVGPARTGLLSMASIAALAGEAPLWWRELAQLTCAHQRLSFREAGRIRSQPASVRLAALLAGNSRWGSPSLRITQDEIARTIGISRQRANRLLAEFAEQGVIRRVYGGIEVQDAAALRRLSSPDQSRP